MLAEPVAEPPQPLADVGERVRRTLAASAEFRALPPQRQDMIARDMVRAGAAAARAIASRRAGGSAGAGAPPAGGLVESVDYPSFVTGLIEGTFEAIVDASIEQLQAYTKLLENVAKPVDEFMRDNVTDEPGGGDVDSARLRRATHRQQVLATMVLMGINRIVVTDGKISASVCFELRPR
jgi:hypothetical protein